MLYTVKICIPSDLSHDEIEKCVSIVCDGGAVDRAKATRNIPRACALAVVRNGNIIVGFGAIKRLQRGHTADVSKRSGYPLDPLTPEVGYMAVLPTHRRKGLSRQILTALIGQHPGLLFATTDDIAMKKTLAGAKFVRKGDEWPGNRGKLSLWVRR
jgi:GNAT superfamily N-acetyltransferase